MVDSGLENKLFPNLQKNYTKDMVVKQGFCHCKGSKTAFQGGSAKLEKKPLLSPNF
jgi:hypothetical protein